MAQAEMIPDALDELSFPEQLILWTARYWADGYRQNYSPYETLKVTYRRAKCPQSLLLLDSFLSLMVAGRSRPVDIRCPCCGGISPDEWRILQSVALAQTGNVFQISGMISHFLEPTTVRHCLPLIFNWAEDLGEHKLLLPVRSSMHEALYRNHAAVNHNKPQWTEKPSHKTLLH
ncbi:MAG: hypothetical protein NXI13_17520 [Proteobacteria bacterium]|nr:hypothetical protein [Pseudomonadota bacterium]